MKKVIRLTESDLTELVKKVINESNIITEQLAMLNYPLASILFTPGDNTKQIKLKVLTDPKKNTYSVLKYDVKAKYTFFNFDVEMRNFKRPGGNLTLEALPNNSAVQKTMRTLVPKESLTPDGWLKVRIPPDKIQEAIEDLKKNKGSSATIDAGQGVKIILSYAK
jgi:hypothetical protein